MNARFSFEQAARPCWPGRTAPAGISRRRFASGLAALGSTAAAAGLVGCSSTKHSNAPATTAATNAATTAGSAIQRAVATPAAAISASPAANAIDPTKGKPGGTLVVQNQAYPANWALVTASMGGSQKIGGLVHSALVQFNFGHPPSNGLDVVVELELAQALPEQPDPLSYVFKLRPGVKFHNGRDLTSQDVQYSFDAYAHGDKNGPSARASSWLWYDHTETPDPQTAVIKTTAPFADAIASCAAHQDGFILAKEFEESPDSKTKLMGSGPYLWGADTAPVSTTIKKNPDFFMKPYPYFDQITFLGVGDPAKQQADFITRQVHFTYSQSAQPAAYIKQNRPDAVDWSYGTASLAVAPRDDQAPFNDKRVRQALSMAIDRKAIRDAVYLGFGEDDQILSPVLGSTWGFRTPSQLGAAAKYWAFDPQAAKQLLAAAGVTQPIESQMTHYDANFIGQPLVDSAVLVQAHWKQAGVANTKDISQPAAQFSAGAGVGNFDGVSFGPAAQQQPVWGALVKNLFWSPPEGVKPPTQNLGHTNDPQLSALLEKQLTQLTFEDRKQTLHAVEDVLAEQQYRICLSTFPNHFFTDPSLRDNVAPKWTYAGSDNYLKYWWFA